MACLGLSRPHKTRGSKDGSPYFYCALLIKIIIIGLLAFPAFAMLFYTSFKLGLRKSIPSRLASCLGLVPPIIVALVEGKGWLSHRSL